MLDDDARAALEAPDQSYRGLQVEQVVVGELLALLPRLEGPRLAGPGVERRLLVRVLAIAQRSHALERHDVHRGRVIAAGAPRQVRGNGRVVARGAREGAHRPQAAALEAGASGLEGMDHLGVLGGIVRHDHIGVVLGRGPQQRDAADVDLLDRRRLVERRRPVLERVERHRDQIDRLEPARHELGEVGRPGASRQDRRVDVRMQRLDPAAQQLRESGPCLDRGDRDAVLPEMPGGPARGDDARSPLGQRAGEVRGAALVREREQRRLGPAHAGGPVRRRIASR